MKLLFTLAVTNQNANAAERLLDFITKRSGAAGNILVCYAEDLHPEMKSRVGISARLAFSGVYEHTVINQKSANPVTAQNDLFKQVAKRVSEITTWPFFWLDADCTPIKPDWREVISAAYESQPMQFMGKRMKVNKQKPEAPDVFFMSRVGAYPAAATSILNFDSAAPFEIASAAKVAQSVTDYPGVQSLVINTNEDLIKVREDAVILKGDTHGILMIKLESQVKIPVQSAEEKTTTPIIRKRRGNQ